jgi:hypothetical protein
MFKLNVALKAGKIDQESYNRAVERAKTALAQTAAQAQQAGQATRQAFGGAAASLNQYVMGFASMTTAIQLFARAMAYAQANTDAAMASVEKYIETRRELKQMADTGQEFQQFEEFANRLSMFGMPRGGAQEIISAAQAEGFTGNEELVARLVAANELSPQSVRTLAGQIPSIFDKQITPMQGIAGGALAGKFSRLTVDELAAMLPKAAQGGAISGATPAETMALGATLVTRGERAPEYMGTFASQLATGEYRSQFAGLGVVGAVEKLQAMPEEERQEILGTGKETNLTYRWVLQDKELIEQRTAAIQQAFDDAESYVGRVEKKTFDPTTAQGRLMIARREAIVAANRLEIQREEQLAEGGYLRRAAKTRGIAMGEVEPAGPVGRYLGSAAATWAEEMRVPAPVVEQIPRATPWMISPLTQLEMVISAVSKHLTGASEKLDESADNLRGSTGEPNLTNAARANQAAAGGAVEAR